MARENENAECCMEECVHEDLLKIVNDTIPERRNFMIWRDCLRCLGILRESVSFLSYSRRKYVCVILHRR